MNIDMKTLKKEMNEDKKKIVFVREVTEVYTKQELIQKKNSLIFQKQNNLQQIIRLQAQNNEYDKQIAECDEAIAEMDD